MCIDDVPGMKQTTDCGDLYFTDGRVTSVGQIIGIVVAKTRELAQRAAKLVKVTYKALPAILTIEVFI